MKYINLHVHPPLSDHNSDVISVVDISSPTPSMSTAPPYCSYGIHPWSLSEENAVSQLQQLETLLQNNTIVAIGEVGFDAVRGADMALQERVFEEIITLSEHYKRPLIIHCVKAWDELLSCHKNRKVLQTWLIHGFHAHHELALQLTKRNILLSFGCKLLNNTKLQSVFSKIPVDFLFLETDNAGVNIVDLYRTAAAIRKIEVETLKDSLFENFRKVF
jgi:TatD DNase family protein